MTVSSQPVSQIDKMGNKTCNIRKKVHENLIKRDIIASYISFSPYAIKVERVISHVICSKTVFLERRDAHFEGVFLNSTSIVGIF